MKLDTESTLHLNGACATFESLETSSKQNEEHVDLRLHAALSAAADGVSHILGSQEKPPAAHAILGQKIELGGNTANGWFERLLHAFFKLNKTIPASKTKASFDAFVQRGQSLESFLTLYRDMNTPKASSVQREQSQLCVFRYERTELRRSMGLAYTMSL